MCQQLSQHYPCGHSKPICLTPCPHALDTGARIPLKNSDTSLSRSGSTVSVSAPSVKRSDTGSLPSQLRSPLPPSPLSHADPLRVQPAPPLPPRSNSSNQPSPLGPPPGFQVPSSTSPPPVPVQRWSIANPDRPASPASLTSNSIASPALPDEEFTIAPNFCPYHFPRDLPQSNHPCIECYFLPEWAHLAERYVKSYAEGHPLNKREDAEKMSGIERLRKEFREKQEKEREQREMARKGDETEGKLNVFLHGDESAGRVG
ncbi:hypothetical protein CC86DRAFT_437011 [Ophiobolus disseminans]|uniref:Uncharacterized protein n=1 Tax=Ophiobolus disseminans TaxID=1469910 RepID=A0A6A7A7R4_9PLEO|nr:hypothetical protein CC86DRAFT_437011 [Ophiobolus disseminans]